MKNITLRLTNIFSKIILGTLVLVEMFCLFFHIGGTFVIFLFLVLMGISKFLESMKKDIKRFG